MSCHDKWLKFIGHIAHDSSCRLRRLMRNDFPPHHPGTSEQSRELAMQRLTRCPISEITHNPLCLRTPRTEFAEILFLIAEATMACRRFKFSHRLMNTRSTAGNLPNPDYRCVNNANNCFVGGNAKASAWPSSQLLSLTHCQQFCIQTRAGVVWSSEFWMRGWWCEGRSLVMLLVRFIYSFIEHFPGSHFNPWTKACKLANFPAECFDVPVHATPFLKFN